MADGNDPPRPGAYRAESAGSSVTRWRVGDAFQERARGLVHTYRLTAIAPHTTRAGLPSVITYWRGTCAVCGGVLMALAGKQPRELVRTCLQHRGQWLPPKRRRANG